MLCLSGTTQKLQLDQVSVGYAVEYTISYVDISSTDAVPGVVHGTATATSGVQDILAAPAAGVVRQIKFMSLVWPDTVVEATVARIELFDGTTTRTVSPNALTMEAGEAVQFTPATGFACYTSDGRLLSLATRDLSIATVTSTFYKIGTTTEGASWYYSWAKDTGFPGAWVPGTPGLAGRATNGTLAADAGSLLIPTGGTPYLTRMNTVVSVTCTVNLWDVLWVNSGIVVTTTTAQTINSVAFPARDLNGTADGFGVQAALLVTTATTNAAPIATITMSYTNSAGVAGRTATMSSFAATAAVGTVVPFQLAAGDRGVRSIQSITLGTSLLTGAVSLIAYVPIAAQPVLVAHTGSNPLDIAGAGIKLFPTACILPIAWCVTTTALAMQTSVEITLR